MSDDTTLTAADPGLASRVLYQVIRWVFIGLFKAYFRLTVEGTDRIPEGSCVWCPNHRSYIDTPIHAVVPRRMRFMGKASMWKNRYFGWVFTTIGCFPVARGTADRDAMNTALAVLEASDDPVVVYPEGERKDGPRMFPVYDGAVYMAARAQVPIVPVGIGGTAAAMPRGARFMYPRKVHIIIGEPIPPPPLTERGRVSRKEISRLSAQLREDIQALFDAAMERVGTPNDYVPGSEPEITWE